MGKAIEVNELERYSERLCECCDFKIANYSMRMIKDNDSVAYMVFCKDCFSEFTALCHEFLDEGGSKDEKNNL